MTQKPRLIRIALELDENLLKEVNDFIELQDQITAPSKLSRSDFIRAAIQAHLQKEKQKIESMKELGRLIKKLKS